MVKFAAGLNHLLVAMFFIELKPVQYHVKVYTADVKSAGTDANVSIILYGENGDTGKRELKKKFKDLFERGNMDDFKIEALDLGKALLRWG